MANPPMLALDSLRRCVRISNQQSTATASVSVSASYPFQLVSPRTGRPSHWASVHTWSASPALIAGVRGLVAGILAAAAEPSP